MYVVIGASGHTGSVVARTLLERGKPVRVVVRDETKGADWKQRGAEVVRAELQSPELGNALRNAEGVYFLVPPNYSSQAMPSDQRRVVDAFANAVESARPRRVVLLSSVGAQHAAGNGPIASLHYAEERLRRQPSALTALRAAYFMENWGAVLPLARGQGILPSMFKPGLRIPMVATADIGRVAAEALLDGEPGTLELAGPADYTADEVAATAAKILGRAVQKIDVPEEGVKPALEQAGVSEHLAGLFAEMYRGINSGHVAWEKTPVRGRVTLEEALRGLV